MLTLNGDGAPSRALTPQQQILQDLADEVNVWEARYGRGPYFTACTSVDDVRWILRGIVENWARGERQAVNVGLVERILLLYSAPAVEWYRDKVRAEGEYVGPAPSIPHGRGREERWPFLRKSTGMRLLDSRTPPTIPSLGREINPI